MALSDGRARLTWDPMPLLRRRVDDGLLELFEESGRNVQRAGLLLRDMLTDFPERAPLARDLLLCEQEGDRIAHDIIHRLNGQGPRRGRPPFGSADVYELTRTLDDIVDYAEQTGDALGLYGVEAAMEQAVALSEVLVGAGEEVARAARPAHRRRFRPAADRDPSSGERGRPTAPRRRRLAVRNRHRSDAGDPLEGHLRVARGRRGRVRDRGPRARGDRAQAPARVGQPNRPSRSM